MPSSPARRGTEAGRGDNAALIVEIPSAARPRPRATAGGLTTSIGPVDTHSSCPPAAGAARRTVGSAPTPTRPMTGASNRSRAWARPTGRLAAKIPRFEAGRRRGSRQTGEAGRAHVFLLCLCHPQLCRRAIPRGPSLRPPGWLGKTGSSARAGNGSSRLHTSATGVGCARRAIWREHGWRRSTGFRKTFDRCPKRLDAPQPRRRCGSLVCLALSNCFSCIRAGAHRTVPSPFRRLDMSHHDAIAMAHLLIERLPLARLPSPPGRAWESLVLTSRRSSGPSLKPKAYEAASLLTIELKKGSGWSLSLHAQVAWQGGRLRRHGVDDPPDPGCTVQTVLDDRPPAPQLLPRIVVKVPGGGGSQPLASRWRSPRWTGHRPRPRMLAQAPHAGT